MIIMTNTNGHFQVALHFDIEMTCVDLGFVDTDATLLAKVCFAANMPARLILTLDNPLSLAYSFQCASPNDILLTVEPL